MSSGSPAPATPGGPTGHLAQGAPGQLLAANVVCCHCEQQCHSAQMCAWGKNAMFCHICKTNYNRMGERVTKDAQLKLWWKKMEKEERAEWYQRNKATYEPNRRKAFNSAGL